MKKFVFLLLSVSLFVLITSNTGVKSQKVSKDVAYSDSQSDRTDRPIQPPVG